MAEKDTAFKTQMECYVDSGKHLGIAKKLVIKDPLEKEA